jgi:hypothetical protein
MRGSPLFSLGVNYRLSTILGKVINFIMLDHISKEVFLAPTCEDPHPYQKTQLPRRSAPLRVETILQEDLYGTSPEGNTTLTRN